MKGLKINLIMLFSFIFLTGCFVHASNDDHWNSFLNRPDKDSLVKLEDYISLSSQRCSWGNAQNLSVVPIEKGQQLFKLIAAGNEYAFYAGLMVRRCFDGGELEDYYRSTGIFFEQQPKTFLKIVKEKAIPDSDIKNMLTSLPLDTVDNIPLKIRAVENRITLLGHIDEGFYKETREKSLSFLKNERESLNKINEPQGQ